MSATTKEQPVAIGLDIGTSRIVTAQRFNQDDRYEAQLNAFVTLPFTKMAAASMTKEGVPHTVAGDDIIVFGNESARIADLFGREIRRPMTRGLLNADEPDSHAQMEAIVRSLVGKASGGDTKVRFSVPAPPLNAADNLTYHEATVTQILQGLGYKDIGSVNEGLAVVYSELEESNYTGIGVSCGGGLCNVSVAYMSVPVLSFSIAKGGDFIDSSAAGVTGELQNRVRIAKEETFHFNGHFADKVQQAITVYYDDMIQSVVAGLREAFQATRNAPKFGRAVPLVLSGGSTMPKGFRDRFARALDGAALPLSVSEVRLAGNPLHATAKGALVAALSE